MAFNLNNVVWSFLVFAGFGLSVCLHEFGHAIVAYWGGDRSVKEKGYLTLNPLKYTHPTYSILLPFVFLLMGGIPLPGAAVYINRNAIKGKAWNSAVSAAGPLATCAVAVALAFIINVLPIRTELNPLNPDANLLFQGLALLLTLEVAGVFLNLMPVPGLDGYGIIEPWLPSGLQQQLRRYAQYGVWVLFGAFWFVPEFGQGFWVLVSSVSQWGGVSPEVASLGFSRFRQGAQVLFLALLVVWIGYNQWKKRQPQTVDSLADKQATYRALHHKSREYFHAQKYALCIETLDEAIALHPTDATAFYNQACCYAQLGQIQAGITALEKAFRYEPSAENITENAPFQASEETFEETFEETPKKTSKKTSEKTSETTSEKTLKQQAQTDEDLEPLRSHPDYAALFQLHGGT